MDIKTDRLELKAISPDSRDALVELLTDNTVKQTYILPEFDSVEAAQKLAQRLMDLSRNEERYVAGIYLGESLIGILNETEVAGEQIEIGYALLPRYYNQGYCTEALGCAIKYFSTHGFREVVAGAFSENAASIRVMEKNGMEKLPWTDEIEYRGKVHTCVYYVSKK